MKSQKRKLMSSIVLVIASITMAISLTYAWFLRLNYISYQFLLTTGNSSVNTNVFIGIDSNRDGILDNLYDQNDQLINYTRATKLQNCFNEATKNSVNLHQEVVAQSEITFKIVIENPSANKYSSKISINFSNLDEYIYSYVDYFVQNSMLPQETEQNFASLLGNNSSRVLYNLKDLEIRRYSNNVAFPNFERGYETLTASSVQAETTNDVELINNINSLQSLSNTSLSYHLWQISSEEEFVSNVLLNKNEIMEVDFKLKCVSVNDIAQSYQTFSNTYVTKTLDILNKNYPTEYTLQEKTNFATAYVNSFISAEFSYFFTDNDSLIEKQLDFSINKICIYATNYRG